MKAEAILKLNPNVKTVVSNNDGTFKVLDVNDTEISVDIWQSKAIRLGINTS
jgi:hypothetical protein